MAMASGFDNLYDAIVNGGNVEGIYQRGLQNVSADRVGADQANLFGQLMRQQGGFLNSLLGQQMLAGQMAGQSTIANLNRQGLGNTGLGAALSGALQRGSAFQGNNLRAKLMSEMQSRSWTSALGLAQLRAGLASSAIGGIAGIQAAREAQPSFLESAGQAGVGYALSQL